MDPYFHLFCGIIISFFSFFCPNKSITGSNCVIIECNMSKKRKLAVSEIDRVIDKHRVESQTGACIVQLYDYGIKKLQSPLNTSRKYILLIYFTFLVKALSPSFHYIFGIYKVFAIHFTKSKLMARSVLEFSSPEKKLLFLLLGIYMLYIISYLLWNWGRIWYIFQTVFPFLILLKLLLKKPRASAENIGIKVSALSPSSQLFTATVLPIRL